MNKKSLILVIAGLLFAAITYLAYNALSIVDDFEFSDPFETEFEDK